MTLQAKSRPIPIPLAAFISCLLLGLLTTAAAYFGAVFGPEDVPSPKPAPAQNAGGTKTPRLAFVSTGSTPAIENILALAEAKLSSDSVVLVDRREISRIVAEQKLSLSGFVKEDQVVKVGKLLGVNLFAVLETAPGNNQAVGLVVFDAVSGARLWDALVPDGELDAMTTGVGRDIKSAIEKYQKLNKGLKAVCVSAVRNVGLPPNKQPVCEAIGILLERGFVSSPSLALLERTRLDQVLKERNLKTDTPAQGILASLVRVELEIGPGTGGKGIGATALLFDGSGTQYAKASVDVASANAAEVAQALQAKVLKLLEAAPPPNAPDRVREAARFAVESDYLRAHGDRSRMLQAQEAAFALHPESEEQNMKLIWNYSQEATRLMQVPVPDEKIYQSLEMMGRAVEEMTRFEAALRRDPMGPKTQAYVLHTRWYLARIGALEKSQSARTKDLAARVHEGAMKLADDQLKNRLAKVDDRESFGAVLTTLTEARSPLVVNLDPVLPADLKLIWHKHLTRFIELAEQHGPASPNQDQLFRIYNVLRAATHVGVAPAVLKRQRDTLRKSRDPYVTLYDKLVDYQIQLDRNRSPAEVHKAVAGYRLFLQELLDSDQARDSQLFRWYCYQSFRSLLRFEEFQFDTYDDPLAKEFCALADFMLARKEIQISTTSLVTNGCRNTSVKANRDRAVDYMDRMLRLLDSPDCCFLFETEKTEASMRKDLKGNMAANRARLLKSSLTAARSVPWTQLDEFMDVAGATQGFVRLNNPVVHEKAVYVVLFGQEKSETGRFFQLCRFSLPDGKKTLLGKITLNTGYKLGGGQKEFDRFPTPVGLRHALGGLIHDGRYFVGTRDQGILIFPLDGGKVERLHTGAGLPADQVQSLACVGDTLFAGLGETGKSTFIIAHDLKRGQTKILASSSRVEVQSPFDNVPTFRVVQLQADPARQRVLAFVNVFATKTLETNGLWEIDAKEGRFRQLLARRFLIWMSPAFDGKLVLSADELILFDLKSSQTKSIKAANPTSGQLVESRLAALRELAKLQPLPEQLCEGHFIHAGWLWASHEFGRVSLNGARKELFVSPRKNSKALFEPLECFQLVGNNQVLIADAHGMWLATLPVSAK